MFRFAFPRFKLPQRSRATACAHTFCAQYSARPSTVTMARALALIAVALSAAACDALVATPASTFAAAPRISGRGGPLRMSWQPNSDYNGESSGRLTDFERSARDAGVGDRKVTIRKPLGLILDEDAKGDVFVKEVVKGGNAESVGGISKGDVVAMTSGTFGPQMWSTRGAGLDRVTRAIEVRAGPNVSLVVQSKAQQKNALAGLFQNQGRAQEERIAESDRKRDVLEDEIKAERKDAAKKWFGLF